MKYTFIPSGLSGENQLVELEDGSLLTSIRENGAWDGTCIEPMCGVWDGTCIEPMCGAWDGTCTEPICGVWDGTCIEPICRACPFSPLTSSRTLHSPLTPLTLHSPLTPTITPHSYTPTLTLHSPLTPPTPMARSFRCQSHHHVRAVRRRWSHLATSIFPLDEISRDQLRRVNGV